LSANPFQSAREIKHELGLSVSHLTIWRYLTDAGFVYRKSINDFHLTPEDKTQRLDLASLLIGQPVLDHLVFVDESTFWLNDNNHKGWFHSDCEHPLSLNKHQGKVNMCAGISAAGKIDPITFKSSFNSNDYLNCLQEYLVPLADSLHPRGWYLIQDNGPCHKGSAGEFIQEHLQYITFPKRSPDLNPIENIWKLFKQAVRKEYSKTIEELEDSIHENRQNVSS